MKNCILAVSEDNGFLAEQLKIEGISCTSKTHLAIEEGMPYRMILIGNIELKKEEIWVLTAFIEQGGKVIVLKPSDWLFNEFQLKGSANVQKYVAEINSYDCQLCNAMVHPAQEMVITKTIGKGKLSVFAYDVLESIYLLTHGNDVIIDRDNDGVLRVDDGIVVEKGKENYPQADIIREHLVNHVLQELEIPLPRIWYYPHGKRAGICFTHDSDIAEYEQVKELEEIEKSEGISATVFIRPNEQDVFEKIGEGKDKDWQLHSVYLRFPKLPPLLQSFFEKILSSRIIKKFQKNRLKNQKQSSVFNVIGNRNHGLLWNRRNDHPVWMQEAGIKYDSTLGANYDAGYFHGTGKPFFLRTPGQKNNTDVLEFSSQLMEAALIKKHDLHGKNIGEPFAPYFDSFEAYTRDFIDGAVEKFHALAVVSFHYPYIFSNKGKERVREWYLSTIKYAKEKDMLAGNMSYWNSFWRDRHKTELEFLKYDSENKILTVKVIPSHNIQGLTLTLRAEFQSRRLKKIEAGNESLQFSFHKEQLLVEFKPRYSKILKIQYQ